MLFYLKQEPPTTADLPEAHNKGILEHPMPLIFLQFSPGTKPEGWVDTGIITSWAQFDGENRLGARTA